MVSSYKEKGFTNRSNEWFKTEEFTDIATCYKEAIALCLEKTKNLPGILNDDTLIPALYNSLTQDVESKKEKKKFVELVNDYCVDGCWEPVLNGCSDWTFGMLSCFTIFQCAITALCISSEYSEHNDISILLDEFIQNQGCMLNYLHYIFAKTKWFLNFYF